MAGGDAPGHLYFVDAVSGPFCCARHYPEAVPPAPQLSPTDADALRADLDGWTVDSVGDVLGERATAALGREQLVPALRAARAAGRDRIALLTRLFMLGDALTPAEVNAALPRMGVDGLVRCRMLGARGTGSAAAAVALCDLRPYAAADGDEEATWWVASDLGEAVTGARLADDHVLGIGGASTTLASVTMRRPVGRVLDLGTGSGIQALHASMHADVVVATDISRRALAFAAFNRVLNEPKAAWDLREGSLLEPVQGELFDLVVSNPPFVISPPGTPHFEYRDGGMTGDGVVRSLVSTVGSVLAPGGIAQMLGNWEIRRGDGWQHRLDEWLSASAAAGHPLDAWIIQRDVLDAAAYAETWMRDSGITADRDPAAYEACYGAYLDDFDARGVDAVGFGIITLRRAEGTPTLHRLEEHEGPLPSPLGPHVAASLSAHDWLNAHSDAEILAERWVVAADVTQESYAQPGAEHPQHVLLRQGGAFGRSVKADTALAGFVGACDGELTGAQIATALAGLLDVPAERMHNGLADAVRDLARDGFITHTGE